MRVSAALGLVAMAGVSVGQTHSRLWGKAGEAWSPGGRLPDFSYAGYHCGEDPLPEVEAVTDVCRFGAKGDGKTDCTKAFMDAIEATDRGAIEIPPGRYLISGIIEIKKPNIVLRGAGPEKTVLYVTKELEDVKPNMGATTGGRPTSNYSWSGGFIRVQGNLRNKKIAVIASESERGARDLVLDKPADLTVGQRVMIELQDDGQKTLITHLYSGDPGNLAEVTKAIRLRMVSRVASVDGVNVTLGRPLRFDVRSAWTPVLRTFEPTVSEVGVEELSIEFPVKPYKGHFTERGMNGIAVYNSTDCWVRNVHIINSDSGIFMGGIFCTVDGLILDSKRPDYSGTTGHHGITAGSDCLVLNFDFRTHFIHDITVSYLNAGNVIKNGKGVNLSLDHHKKAPHENLFCNLDVGKGSEIWRCGGGRNLGKNCGAHGTFWCITAREDISMPPSGFGPDSINLVGLKTAAKSQMDSAGKWIECIAPEELVPADLHAAQLERRLGLATTDEAPADQKK